MSEQRVAVLGMGHVGQTLAAFLAGHGTDVTGVDIRDELVRDLQQGNTEIREPGLQSAIRSGLEKRRLSFCRAQDLDSHSVYIICVGVPLTEERGAYLGDLLSAASLVARLLRKGDLVFVRSTLPVGATRRDVRPLLEDGGLRAGEDFALVYAPERMLEGKALEELESLPQILGGYTAFCAEQAERYWSLLPGTTIVVDSLEAAELIKLANNAFRDLSFAFANDLALQADRYNLDAFALVKAANQGYKRNPIPMPSPGVGGSCLPKDPYLYAGEQSLSHRGREVNLAAAHYPIEMLERFGSRIQKSLSEIEVLAVGLAFKGDPETDDLRGSAGLHIVRALVERGVTVRCWDAAVPAQQLQATGCVVVDSMQTAMQEADAILLLNNHPAHRDLAWIELSKGSMPKLLFDGWHQLDRHELERMPGLVYATMGYVTSEQT